MKICMMANFGRKDDDVFETCVKSFRSVSDARLEIISDVTPREGWVSEYDLTWIPLPVEEVKDKMCFCSTDNAIKRCCELEESDQFILADIDLYFMRDPFDVFKEKEFNVGVTTRCHSFVTHIDINFGITFIRPTKSTCDMLAREWQKYIIYDNRRQWHVDQGFANHLYEYFGAVDVGWYWNYCPAVSYYGYPEAIDMLERAYKSKSVGVLHFKDRSKYIIYEGFLEHAVNKNWTDNEHCALAFGQIQQQVQATADRSS